MSCEEEFRKAGLDFNIIEAIDGKELKLPHDNFSSIKYSLLHGKKSNLGELGCYLSHLKVLKTFIESEENYALVCEDDIKIDSEIKEIVDKALNSDIDFDLLRLSGGSNPSIEKGIPVKLRQLTDKYHLALNFGFKSGTGSYLINRKAAEAILKKLKVTAPIRVRANLSLRDIDTIESGWHMDGYHSAATTGILYLTSCNGKTVVKTKDGDVFVDSVENRMLLFPQTTRHKVIYQTDVHKRYIVNFNYFGKLCK